jgi:hypothetical protein
MRTLLFGTIPGRKVLHVAVDTFGAKFEAVFRHLKTLEGRAPTVGFAVVLLAVACTPRGTVPEAFGFNWSNKQHPRHPVWSEQVRGAVPVRCRKWHFVE